MKRSMFFYKVLVLFLPIYGSYQDCSINKSNFDGFNNFMSTNMNKIDNSTVIFHSDDCKSAIQQTEKMADKIELIYRNKYSNSSSIASECANTKSESENKLNQSEAQYQQFQHRHQNQTSAEHRLLHSEIETIDKKIVEFRRKIREDEKELSELSDKYCATIPHVQEIVVDYVEEESCETHNQWFNKMDETLRNMSIDVGSSNEVCERRLNFYRDKLSQFFVDYRKQDAEIEKCTQVYKNEFSDNNVVYASKEMNLLEQSAMGTVILVNYKNNLTLQLRDVDDAYHQTHSNLQNLRFDAIISCKSDNYLNVVMQDLADGVPIGTFLKRIKYDDNLIRYFVEALPSQYLNDTLHFMFQKWTENDLRNENHFPDDLTILKAYNFYTPLVFNSSVYDELNRRKNDVLYRLTSEFMAPLNTKKLQKFTVDNWVIVKDFWQDVIEIAYEWNTTDIDPLYSLIRQIDDEDLQAISHLFLLTKLKKVKNFKYPQLAEIALQMKFTETLFANQKAKSFYTTAKNQLPNSIRHLVHGDWMVFENYVDKGYTLYMSAPGNAYVYPYNNYEEGMNQKWKATSYKLKYFQFQCLQNTLELFINDKNKLVGDYKSRYNNILDRLWEVIPDSLDGEWVILRHKQSGLILDGTHDLRSCASSRLCCCGYAGVTSNQTESARWKIW